MSVAQSYHNLLLFIRDKFDDMLPAGNTVFFLDSWEFIVITKYPIFWWLVIILLMVAMELTSRFRGRTHIQKEVSKNDDVLHTDGISKNHVIDGINHVTERRLNNMQQLMDIVHNYSTRRDSVEDVSNATVPDLFCDFIREDVISSFHLQRIEGNDQFAVLFLSRIESLRDIKRVKFKCISFNKHPLVDSTFVSYPEDHRLTNYLVARSSSTDKSHPVKTILKKFPTLLSAYKCYERCHIRKSVPKHVVLYSWKMPCTSCTDKILRSSVRASGCKHAVIAYTVDQIQENDNERNRERLRKAGYTLVRVVYRGRLPDVGKHCIRTKQSD